jgi:alpha-beta hydrolase superfamily lysophospholipase
MIIESAGKKIEIELHTAAKQASGMAIIVPGFAETMEETYLQTIIKALGEIGVHSVIFNPSAFADKGAKIQASFASYVQDIAMVHEWVKKHFFYKKNYLAGHSIGAAAAFHYALEKEGEIERIIMLAPLLNQKIYLRESLKNWPQVYADWERTGILEKASSKGENYKIGYGFVTSLSKMNVPKLAPKNQTPCGIFAATQDKITPLVELEEVAKNMPRAELIKLNAGHFFKTSEELAELKNKLEDWLFEDNNERIKTLVNESVLTEKIY